MTKYMEQRNETEIRAGRTRLKERGMERAKARARHREREKPHRDMTGETGN